MGIPLTGTLRTLASVLLRMVSIDVGLGQTVSQTVRQVLVSGVSITLPFVVTAVVLGVVFDFLGNTLAPLVQALTYVGLAQGTGGLVDQGFAVAILMGVVVLAGVLSESGSAVGLGRSVGSAVEALPGIGSVYTSFDRMSEVMLDGDGRSFREVKLVEFPHEDIYSLAFLTSEVRPGTVGEEKMLVLFVPLAPNPVMGGFMVFMPEDRVRDVDLTVEQAFQGIVTSGVAITDSDR